MTHNTAPKDIAATTASDKESRPVLTAISATPKGHTANAKVAAVAASYDAYPTPIHARHPHRAPQASTPRAKTQRLFPSEKHAIATTHPSVKKNGHDA